MEIHISAVRLDEFWVILESVGEEAPRPIDFVPNTTTKQQIIDMCQKRADLMQEVFDIDPEYVLSLNTDAKPDKFRF